MSKPFLFIALFLIAAPLWSSTPRGNKLSSEAIDALRHHTKSIRFEERGWQETMDRSQSRSKVLVDSGTLQDRFMEDHRIPNKLRYVLLAAGDENSRENFGNELWYRKQALNLLEFETLSKDEAILHIFRYIWALQELQQRQLIKTLLKNVLQPHDDFSTAHKEMCEAICRRLAKTADESGGEHDG